MNLAVCFYGEPRTYKYNVGFIRNFYEIGGINVDYFLAIQDRDGCGCSSWVTTYVEYDADILRSELVELFETDNVEILFPCKAVDNLQRLGIPILYYSQVKALENAVLPVDRKYDLIILDRLDSYRPFRKLNISEITQEIREGKAVGVEDIQGTCPLHVSDRTLIFNKELALEYYSTILPWRILQASYPTLSFGTRTVISQNCFWSERDLSNYLVDRKIDIVECPDIQSGMLRTVLLNELVERLKVPVENLPQDLVYEVHDGFEDWKNNPMNRGKVGEWVDMKLRKTKMKGVV